MTAPTTDVGALVARLEAEAVEAMRDDPFCDDARLLGTTGQDQRMQHYASIAAQVFATALQAESAARIAADAVAAREKEHALSVLEGARLAVATAEARADREKARADENRVSWLRAESEAYELKYAAAGGEDAPGSAHMVTVADVDRWRREGEAALTACRQDTAKLIAEAVVACARVVEDHQITSTSGGNVLSKRGEGNREGLAYAEAIRARTTGGSDHGE